MNELNFRNDSAFWNDERLNLQRRTAQILQELWENDFIPKSVGNSLKVHVTWIRNEFKAKGVPFLIRNVYSKGYCIQPKVGDARTPS